MNNIFRYLNHMRYIKRVKSTRIESKTNLNKLYHKNQYLNFVFFIYQKNCLTVIIKKNK